MKENRIAGFFKGVGNTFGLIGTAFSKGDWKTKLSFIIMGIWLAHEEAVCPRNRVSCR